MAGKIDQLIVNGPYDEPERHWRYHRESRTFSLEPGRRPAGYIVATPGSRSFDAPGVFVPLPLVNRIRPRLKAWRDAGYPGITGTTLRLLPPGPTGPGAGPVGQGRRSVGAPCPG